MMKSVKKAIIAALCAGTLVVGSVAGTMAYLTSTDEVVNTFTVGNVAITLDETDVDINGAQDGTTRVTENQYKLMPGHTYIKDPTVHFSAGSEASFLFVKVENGISSIEASDETTQNGYKTIASQIAANKWTALNNVEGVYYKQVDANTGENAVDYPVFGKFKIAGTVNGTTLEEYAVDETDPESVADRETIKVTAYAVQKDGFNDAAAAWNATFGAPQA